MGLPSDKLAAHRDLRIVEARLFSSVKLCHRLLGGEAGGMVVVCQEAELLHIAERFREILGLDREFLLEFMLPDEPFSSFIAARVRGRFPIFERVLAR